MSPTVPETQGLPALPAGFTTTHARLEDAERLIAPRLQLDALYNGSPTTTLQDFVNQLQRPDFNLEENTRAIFAPNSDCAGYAEMWAEAPYFRNFVFVYIHPQYTNLGLGTWMTIWGIDRVRTYIGKAPLEIAIGVNCYPYTNDTAALELLTKAGFTQERIYYEMAIKLNHAPEVTPLPDGVILRTFDPDNDMDTLFDVYIECFRDHFGYIARPREEAFARFRRMVMEQPTYDPTLITLAEHAGKPVGFTVTRPDDDTPDSYGYINYLGTVRSWRRRGLARALLTRVFAQYHARGAQGVLLGVDAASPTGALDLYIKSGMNVKSSTTSLRLVLRDGSEPPMDESSQA
jgi:ribosomal protein S18 acetylase RimI-like enzyme